jgi:hypothetical protein
VFYSNLVSATAILETFNEGVKSMVLASPEDAKASAEDPSPPTKTQGDTNGDFINPSQVP